MFFFVLSVFLSAFLLFQVQPMIGKFILPRFGGSPAVWTTAMLFFQILLTGGYAYAYWLIAKVNSGRQSLIHSLLMLASVGVMLFTWSFLLASSSSQPWIDVSSPVVGIFTLLLISVGLPYFLLAANGPLMQAWFSRRFPQQSYARLYSLSNIGSLLGLLAYPTLIEPNLSLRAQGWMWFISFGAFGVLILIIAFQNRAVTGPTESLSSVESDSSANRPTRALQTLWIVLAATASLLLLSVTNQISQEVAVIPFLWILPLTLYLLSFILAFSGEAGYSRRFYLMLFAVSVLMMMYVYLYQDAAQVYLQVSVYCLLLFSSCMLCHGELYRLRPDSRYLTSYYLMVSVGGALGGLFVSLLAPLIFSGYWELMVGLAMMVALWMTVLRAKSVEQHASWATFMAVVFLAATVLLSCIDLLQGSLFAKRNFYGVIRIKLTNPKKMTEDAYTMTHGITIHGMQFTKPEMRETPSAYYVRDSGVGLALDHHRRIERGLKVGVLGLGAGTLAAYGKPGDQFRFYEINPIVIELAEGQGGYFSYLKNTKAKVTTVLGDARISLERELAQSDSQQFDVLVLDTFSSDSIPMHLVTSEAFDLYLKHLAPDGLIAAHISNRYLDLNPVFWQLAQHHGLKIVSVLYPGDEQGGFPSEWLLLARNPAVLETPAIKQRSSDMSKHGTSILLWTDDYSNLLQILK